MPSVHYIISLRRCCALRLLRPKTSQANEHHASTWIGTLAHKCRRKYDPHINCSRPDHDTDASLGQRSRLPSHRVLMSLDSLWRSYQALGRQGLRWDTERMTSSQGQQRLVFFVHGLDRVTVLASQYWCFDCLTKLLRRKQARLEGARRNN